MTLLAEDTKRLRRFQDRVQELKERKFFEDENRILRQELKFDVPNQRGESTFSGFNDDAFRAGIQILRQFTLDRDQVHFLSICKIIRRKCERPELVEWCNYARTKWREILQSKRPIGVRSGEKELTLQDALELLFYGSMSHTLKKGADEWDSFSPVIQQAIYFNAQSGMFNLMRSLGVVDSVIHIWLDDPTKPVPPLKKEGDSESSSDSTKEGEA